MKRLLCMIALLAVMLSVCAVTVSANAPLTPDIIITLEQPYDGNYIVAVLSDRNAFFHYDDWYHDENYYLDPFTDDEIAALKKLHSVGDEDGYDYIADLDGFNKESRGTYVEYPYDTFKIALYFPDTDTLVKTDILVRRNYIHLYQLTLDGKAIKDVQTKQDLTNGVFRPAVTTVRPYYQEQMMFQFLVCLTFNLVAEILIALLFGYRKWRHILTIAVTNIITLILLTVSVILINPPVYDGLLSFPFAFFEIAVAAVEGAVYAIAFRFFEDGEKYRPMFAVLYAAVANLFTYVIGAFFYLIPH